MTEISRQFFVGDLTALGYADTVTHLNTLQVHRDIFGL